MILGCDVCKRPFDSSALPFSKEASKYPLMLTIAEAKSAGPSSKFEEILKFTICIDCRTSVEPKIVRFLHTLKP